MIRSILKCLLLCLFACSIKCQNPEVEISQGRLLGRVRSNLDGGQYYSFQSIPYAKPPLGELRFKAPEPADSWEGTRDATQDVPECVQEANIGGQEDCLYLNINTPGLPAENVTQLPVMVWIHGGAFTQGSAGELWYGGQFLLTKDIVLVVINYRLGVFGFLSLDDANLGVTGNAGMKDQVLALEWVQTNIEYFGGDPNNVLIFGESAGSMSVQFQLLSPMANGLFHKAISQSGDILNDMFDLTRRRNTGETIARILDIQTDDWEAMLEALQEVPAGELSLAESAISSLNIFGLTIFTPIVEIPSNVGPRFLEDHPINIIRSGIYNRVPFIIGINDAEGLMFQFQSIQSTGESLLIEDFTEYVPKEFNVDGTSLETLLALVIQNFYYGDTEPSRDNITAAIQLTTDYLMAFPSIRTVRECIRMSNDPIYFYYFTAITALNFYRQLEPTVAAYPGAAHADELGYFFNIFTTPSVIEAGSIEDRLLRDLVELWTNFAIYGNPTPDNSGDIVWEPVQEDQFNYLHISNDGIFQVLNSVPEQNRMDFWWALHQQYSEFETNDI